MRGATCYFQSVREASLIKWYFKRDLKVLRVSNGAVWGRGVQAEGRASSKALKQGRAGRDVMEEEHESQRDLSVVSGE